MSSLILEIWSKISTKILRDENLIISLSVSNFFWLILRLSCIRICLKSILQFLKCLLLHHLRILESLDQLELLHFHLLYGCLVIQTLLFLSLHFLMHLLPGLHFLIEHLLRLLWFSFMLLITNQIFDHGGFSYVLIVLVVKELLLLLFFFSGNVDILFYFLAVSPFIHDDFLSLLFFLGFMEQRYLGLLIHFHLLPYLLVTLMLHVSASLVYDVACLPSRLLYFLECSVLFLL